MKLSCWYSFFHLRHIQILENYMQPQKLHTHTIKWLLQPTMQWNGMVYFVRFQLFTRKPNYNVHVHVHVHVYSSLNHRQVHLGISSTGNQLFHNLSCLGNGRRMPTMPVSALQWMRWCAVCTGIWWEGEMALGQYISTKTCKLHVRKNSKVM